MPQRRGAREAGILRRHLQGEGRGARHSHHIPVLAIGRDERGSWHRY